MKKSLSLLTLAVLWQASAINAQPVPKNDADGYENGQVLLPDNSTITGTVKDNIRKKGEVIVLHDGKKIKYKAGDITSVQIGNSNYITNNYTFYEVTWQGNNISLLRKANEPSGVQYNGTDPIVISGSEGDVDDYFITKKGNASFYLLTGKNVKEVLGKLCGDCTVSMDAAKFEITAIKKAVEDCDKCK